MTGMPDGEVGAAATQVLIADQIAHIVEHLEKLADFSDLVQVCGIAREPSELVAEAQLRQPDVVLLGAALSDGDPAELAHEVEMVAPHARILAMSQSHTSNGDAPGNSVHSVGAGVSGAELVSAIRTVHEPPPVRDGGGVIAAAQPAPLPVPASTPEPIHDVAQRTPRAPGSARGEVFVVHSGKGGVGKSVLASNLAVALAVEAGSKVALVDLDLQHGDAGVMLHIDAHARSITDLAADDVTQETLHEVMASGPEGVRVLLAPPSPDRAADINRTTVRAVLAELRLTYDHIVVDTPAHLDEIVLDTIQDADALLLVTTFNVTTVKSSRATLRLLRTLGLDSSRIVLIINQLRPRTTIAASEIEDILRHRMLTLLPYEQMVDDAVDTGRPVVLGQPRSPLTKHLVDVVRYLVPGSAPESPDATHGQSHAHPHPLQRFALTRRWLRG